MEQERKGGTMVIDLHTHIFPAKIAGKTIEKLEGLSGLRAATDGTLEGLQASMEEAGVRASVVMPVITKPEQFASINSYARKISRDTLPAADGGFFSFGAVHPYSPEMEAQLREVKELGLLGIKIHPDYLGVMIDDPKMYRLIDRASELGLAICIHAGIDIGLPDKVHCPPEKSAAMLREVRPEKCILAHMGGWMQWEDVERLLVGRNVWFDTSMARRFLEPETMKRMIRAHGADRIVFGTDSPWGGQAEEIQFIRELGLSAAEEEKLFSGNARKLLGL